jgi:hypothetical protein
MPCAPRAASLSARSFIPWPACARTCWNPTVVPSARRAARALLLRSTSALFLRDAHAPVVVQIAICESERMSTSSPGRTSSRAPVSAWQTALSSFSECALLHAESACNVRFTRNQAPQPVRFTRAGGEALHLSRTCQEIFLEILVGPTQCGRIQRGNHTNQSHTSPRFPAACWQRFRSRTGMSSRQR